MSALEHLAVLAEQRPHALAYPQRGALLQPHLVHFGGAAEGGEGGEVAAMRSEREVPARKSGVKR